MNIALLQAPAGTDNFLTQMGLMIAIFAVMYFVMLRPQKKRDQEAQSMRAGLEVGDEIITRGGIVGRVVSLKDETVLIETGSDRTKLRIARWAVEVNSSSAEKK